VRLVITASRTGIPLPLAFKLSKDEWEKIGDAAAQGMVGNVRRQVTAAGVAQKENAPSTKARKAHAGRPPLSLIDDPASLRFSTRSGYLVLADAKGATISPLDQTVSRHVQKKGYRGWIAPSAKAYKAIRAIVAEAIKRTQASARKIKKKL